MISAQKDTPDVMSDAALSPAALKPYAVFFTDAVTPPLREQVARAFGATVFEQTGTTLPRFADALSTTGGPVLVFLGSPVSEIARRLECGQTVLEACGGWARETRDLLADWRQARARATLLYLDALATLTPSTLEALSQRLGYVPDVNTDIPVSSTPPLLRVVAHLAVAADPALREIADELATATFGGPDGSEIVQCLDTLLSEKERHEIEVAVLRDVLAAQIADGERQQAKLGATKGLSTANIMAEANNRALKAKLADVETRMQHREAVLGAQILHIAAGLAASQQALVGQVEASQRDDAALQTRADSLQQELDTLQQAHEVAGQRIATLEQELAKVYQSRSWRITGPLRATTRKLGSSHN